MPNDEVRIKIRIDSKSQELVLMNQQVKNLGNSFNKTDSMAATFISRLELIGGVAGGLYIVNKTIGDIGRTGFETNRTVQKLTNSLATSIAITSANVDSMGNQITLSQKYAMATDEARLSQEQLNKINLDTPHTLDQTVKIYDAMYIGMKKVGAQSEDIVDITKKLSIAVGDKVGFDAMLSAMDGLSTGTVEVSSEMGRFLKNIGLSNEAIKNSTDVVQLFKDKLSGVKAIESFDTKLSNLTNSYNMLSKAITEPAFNTIEDNLQPAAKILDSLTQNVPAITNIAGEIVQIGTSVGIATLAIKGYTAAAEFATATNALLGGSYGAVNRSILLTTATTRIFSTVLKATPFGLAATAVYFLSDAFMDNADKSKILEDAYNGVGDSLKGLTKNQLEYNKSVIEQELVKASLDRSNAVAKAVNGSLEDKANADAMIKKFEDLTKASRNVKQALEDINQPKAETVYAFDTTEIDKLVNNTLNPYGSKLDEINNKWLSNFNLLVKNGKDTTQYVKAWTKEVSDLDQEEADKKEKLLKANEKLLKDQEKQAEETQKAYLETAQIGMGEYEKALFNIDQRLKEWKKSGVDANEILRVQNVLTAELNKQTLFDTQKEELGYYERKIQLMDDSISKELELQGISYASRILEIEQTTKSIAEKDKLIAKETDLYNLTVQSMNLKYDTEFKDTMSNFYDDMLDSQIALNNAVYDFGSGFDGVSSKIGAVSKSLAAMSTLELTNKKETSKLDKKYIEQFNKYAGDVDKTKALEQQYTKDTAILNEQNIQSQIAGYGLMSGAMSQMFNEGSKEAAAFQMVESGLAIVAGVRAIVSQGSGDPYTAFARMAAMAASVASLLSSAGIAFGTGNIKETTTSDAFSSMEANTGTSSVLGDITAQSESISNSLGILQDFAKPEFELLGQMNKYLASIDQKIGGVSSLLIQNGGFAFGDGFTASNSSKDLGKSSYDKAQAVISKGILGENGAKFLGTFASGANIAAKVVSGLFGKTSVSQSLTDSGIYFADTLLTSAIKQFDGEAYQTISTTTSKKSWFSKSSSTSISSYFDELDNETERQFSLVLDNLYNTTLLAGVALDSASVDTANSLSNFIVDIGKISLKDKTGTQIQELLTSIFGKVGDDIAKTAFPALTDFQQVGEGMFTTLTRVATGMETADYYISRLGNRFDDVIYTAIGNKQGDVGFEALLQSIEAVEVATYPANNNLYKIVENLDATAEELYSMYTNLDELRDRLIFLKQDAQALSNSMIYGAGSVSALDDGFKAYFENFLSENEQLTYKTQQLIKEFNNLGIALPTSKDGFKDLLSGIDKTSESGQELYGRLIILSEEFAGVADSTTSSIEELTTSLNDLSTNSFDTFISSLDNVEQSISSIKQTALSFINGFTTSNSATLEEQLIAYNKLRGQFTDYFDSNGIIKAGVNQSDVSGLYSQITSLASNISGKDSYLKDSLISQINNDLVNFNSSEDVIKVNIVEGLGSLYNLTKEQLTQFKTVASDGKITASELNSIAGLTQTQKNGILDFAKNSSYFSTEDTLSSLNEYAKAQLDLLQTTQANESASLTSQTLTYGDHVGLEEQKQIATKLGVSYDTAKPLIEKIQALSISKNLSSDVQSLMGYTGTSFNQTTASQLDSLSPYLSNDVQNVIASTKDTANANLIAEQARQKVFEAARADFYSRYGNANNNLSIQGNESQNAWTNVLAHIHDEDKSAFTADNIANPSPSNPNQEYYKYGSYQGRWEDYVQQHNEAHGAYSYLQQLLNEKAIYGYAVGTPYLERDQLLYAHQGEIITPRTFSDGIRNGDLVMGDNNKVVAAIVDLTELTKKQAQEIQKMGEQIKEMNERDLIKTVKGVA